MTHAYQNSNLRSVVSWRRIHGNGEETHVVIHEHGDDYVATAVDIDPRSYEAVASAHLGFEPTIESAEKKAEAWMREHPKGILGDGGESGGIGSKINAAALKLMKKLDEYGNKQVEEIQGEQE